MDEYRVVMRSPLSDERFTHVFKDEAEMIDFLGEFRAVFLIHNLMRVEHFVHREGELSWTGVIYDRRDPLELRDEFFDDIVRKSVQARIDGVS